MSEQQRDPQAPTEEEIRAQLERVRVQDVLVDMLVSVVNLSATKAQDREQLRLGIEASKALLALVRDELGDNVKSFDDALSQLQLAYARAGEQPQGADPAAAAPESDAEPKPAAKPGEPGPAQRSGKLWVPGR